jgi:hypothetical protein
MSSTWFKSLSAIRIDIDYHGNGITYPNYILIAETAESNVTNDRGGHDYHKWIYAEGEYDEIMRKVCQGACDFDNGMAKWKPNHKDSVGFIRMVKKALDEAELIEEDKPLPYYLTGYILFYGRVYNKLMEVFEDVEGVEKRKFYGEDVLVAKTIKSYIINKRKVLRMIEDYKESLVNRESFEDWLDYNKDNYTIQIEEKK